jgi:hypothetical protein
MQPYGEPPRPPALTAIAVVSLVWSGLTMIRLLLWIVGVLILGATGWFFGPVVGAASTFVSLLIITVMILSSLLSVILFFAAWHTFLGEPAGRELHRLWAWCNVVLALLALALAWGNSTASWFGLIYAGVVLWVTDLPEVRAYFNRRAIPWRPQKPTGMSEDAL